jgi:hypothetical protein
MTTQYPDPESEAAARAAQIAAVSIALVEAIARLRDERGALRLHADQEHTVTMRAARLTDRAAATAAWAPALDRRWTANADTQALLDAWAPAAAWASEDAQARRALTAIEERLATTHPDAMAAYRASMAEGVDPSSAMQVAARSFTARTAGSPTVAPVPRTPVPPRPPTSTARRSPRR